MSYSTTKRPRPRRGGVALVAACATLLVLALTASPSQAVNTAFCPTGSGYITLSPGVGCTNTDYTLLLSVRFSNPYNPFHCAVGKRGPQQDGSSGNAFPMACGYGLASTGEVEASAYAGGTWAYARGKNDDPGTWGLYYGNKVH